MFPEINKSLVHSIHIRGAGFSVQIWHGVGGSVHSNGRGHMKGEGAKCQLVDWKGNYYFIDSVTWVSYFC